MVSKFFLSAVLFLICCSLGKNSSGNGGSMTNDFYFGADLSYVNQILDRGGVYRDRGTVKSPYEIFNDHGCNLVRLRLWHNPRWTREVYGSEGKQLYNDLKDVERSISESKARGMAVLLDLHYSDTWADPGKQHIPAGWTGIKAIGVLADSVYAYTFNTLKYLHSHGRMPEFVQLGNETNCGMLYSDAPEGFPSCNVCDGSWKNMGEVLNAAIKAVRAVSEGGRMKTKILLHVADPKNVSWWFDNIIAKAAVTDFDLIGFSYYPLWHTSVSVDHISEKISEFSHRFSRDVMILETAYPWSASGSDNYNNQFGSDHQAVAGFEFSEQGQYEFLKKLVTEVKDGGGKGVVYWEPAWISSPIKDLWGTGSSWENCALFDFQGNTLEGIDFMNENTER
jgi:arabinogalactan endo-1,4-beta-galactosidase